MLQIQVKNGSAFAFLASVGTAVLAGVGSNAWIGTAVGVGLLGTLVFLDAIREQLREMMLKK